MTGLAGITTKDERLIGYQQALAAHGIPLDPALIAEGNSRIDGGERATLQLLTQETARPTALFVTSGLMVIGALQAIAQVGLRCPQDLALVGFDDFAWTGVMHPRLTTICQPTYEIGQKATQLLFEQLEKRDVAPQIIRLQPHFAAGVVERYAPIGSIQLPLLHENGPEWRDYIMTLYVVFPLGDARAF